MPKEVHDALHPYLHKLDDRLNPAERVFGHFHHDELNFDMELPREMQLPAQGELLEAGEEALDRFRSAAERGNLPVMPH
jgi:hypothetical protein